MMYPVDPGNDAAQKYMNQVFSLMPTHVTKLAGMKFSDLIDPNPKSKRSKKERSSREKILPPELDDVRIGSNEYYKQQIANPNLVFSPRALGFLPTSYWIANENKFGSLVCDFFQKKNNSNCRFPHKLYNGLLLVEHNPEMYPLVGLKWITDTVFKVDKYIFGRLLGITSINGGLVHSQGNFPSHGFKELTNEEIIELRKQSKQIDDVDMDRVLLMKQINGMFSKDCNEATLAQCKWSD